MTDETENNQTEEAAVAQSAAAITHAKADATSAALLAELGTSACPFCATPRLQYAYIDRDGNIMPICLTCEETKHFARLQQL